ncbi:hypothetical protein [Caenispirillum bisanense]|uniref:Uncharacterized protein n=1 Tax=Caenispirillum bisanense TaxID=414052 RepID=A0A286GNI6_9PROT|nr:hypothetical protein [Caenispirillum bisanense]SOD96544.1 hypothetical protein SAMN05421508_105405 [Caenispirillum bisanense]
MSQTLELYHFTTHHYLASIFKHGICRGKTQVTWKQTVDSVWLTADNDPNRQTWDEGCERLMTPHERQVMMAMDRIFISEDARWPNKREVRLTVHVPTNDPRLVPYIDFARHNVKRGVDRAIRKAAPGCDARDWHLFFGIVPPQWIAAVHQYTNSAMNIGKAANDN